MRVLNWTKRGLGYSLIGENQNKSWSDLFEPEKVSTGKNKDKQLIDLNWTCRGLRFSLTGKNQNKSWNDLSEPEKMSTRKESG